MKGSCRLPQLALALCTLAALAGSGLSVPLRQAQETLCVAQENFVRLASDESCIKYFQCYSGNAYLLQCPDDTWFNASDQICDDGPPPQGCEVSSPPSPPTQPPEEPGEPEPEEPEEPEEPGEPEEPEEPEEPVEEPEEPEEDPEEPEEEPEEPVEEPDDPEVPVVGPEPVEEPDEPVEEPDEPVEEPEEPVDEQSNQPEETIDDNDEPAGDGEQNEDDQNIGEAEEGSGDPENEDTGIEPNEDVGIPNIEEGSGNDGILSYIVRRLGRSEEAEITTEDFQFSSFETSADNSQSLDFDLELDEVFEADNPPSGDGTFETSSDPVLLLSEKAKYK